MGAAGIAVSSSSVFAFHLLISPTCSRTKGVELFHPNAFNMILLALDIIKTMLHLKYPDTNTDAGVIGTRYCKVTMLQ